MYVEMKFYEENQNTINCTTDIFPLEILDSEPGYFKTVIHPMLAPGRETELINWLQMVGIIPQRQICQSALSSDKCERPMFWEPADVIDHFIWRCMSCQKKKSIRENSYFRDLKCTLKDAIISVLGWSKGTDSDTVSKVLNLRKHVVISTFSLCARIAKSFIENNKSEWKIGGPGVVVLIVVYPEGCSDFKKNLSSNGSYFPILCLAEVREIPPRYWFQTLNQYNTSEQIELANKTALETIREVVHPGSILVCSDSSPVCSLQHLQALRDVYPKIVSTSLLRKFDNGRNVLSRNLETIWESAMCVCEEAQTYNSNEVSEFLINQMWRRRFRTESFEMLISQFFIL